MTLAPIGLPALESGDRLSRGEFHRRYQARKDIKKAELVLGVVYVASPVRAVHSEAHFIITAWAGLYVSRHRNQVRGGTDGTVILSDETEVQPDVMLFRTGTQAAGLRVNEKGYAEGAPDLVVEVAASSASYDLHDKLRAYEQAGVPEYLVWRVLDQQLDWFRLQDGRYVAISPDAQGIIESVTFPGLRLNVPKLLAEDVAGVLAELGAPGTKVPG